MLTRRDKKRLVGLIISLIIISLGWLSSRYPQTAGKVIGIPPSGTYKVLKIEDGDTITVDMNGHSETVRFIGVDTPETQDPRKPVQCFGHAAADFTRQLISNQPVRLEADPLSSNRDRYNRLLRYIYLPDGRLVEAEIIKEGFGFAYTSFPFTKADEFLDYQKTAREQNRGLWSSCQPKENQFGGFDSNSSQ